ETFTNFIDAKDPYTNGHSKRVAKYTRMIAKEMGYEGEELDRIYYVALLHDCGKIGVPDNILGKPGKLTDEEFQIIKSHTVRGGDILQSFKSLEDVDEGARFHHERYDGRGYPEGRAGEDIPFIARMICVADSFDAMNTNRVYRNKLTKEKVIEEIETNKGKQFDPKVADVMLNLIRTGKIKVGDESEQTSTPENKQ
nr:HD-GYP domain-containing protein [Erysipelotrichaceae bacterium]